MKWDKHIRNTQVLLCMGLLFSIAYFSPNTSTNSDARYTLLVSQALIEHRTVRLDAYREAIRKDSPVDYRLWEKDGRTYYAYPLATSILAVPFVAVLYWLGYDMMLMPHDDAAQNFISALIVALIFIIVYKIARYYLPLFHSLVIASASVLGTTLMSTIGTALWGLDLAALLICLSLWMLVRMEHHKPFLLMPYLLGLCLFLAYFSRPTTAVFITATLLFLFFKFRRYFWPTALTALFLLALFSLFSQKEFGLWLPPYYLPKELGGLMGYGLEAATPFHIAVYALLFSPSRGFFVFTPIFFLAFIGLFRYWSAVRHHPLLWLIAIWSVGHILLIARFPNWWGGFSFGPRLLTDMVPAWVLLTLFVAQAWLEDPSWYSRQIALVLFLAACAVSILIHSGVGMYGRHMLLSHGHALPPHIDRAPFLLLDWRFPQFLTTPNSACTRNQVYFETLLDRKIVQLNPYDLGQEVLGNTANNIEHLPAWDWWQTAPVQEPAPSPTPLKPGQNETYLPIILTNSESLTHLNALFIGWAVPGEIETASACYTAKIVIGPVTAVSANPLTLTIIGRGHQIQPVTVYINGHLLGPLTFSPDSTQEQLTFPAALLHSDDLNEISLYLPQAFTPEAAIERLPLGIFLEKFLIDQ